MVVFSGLTANGLMAIVLCWLYPWQFPSIMSKEPRRSGHQAFALFQYFAASGHILAVSLRQEDSRLQDKERVISVVSCPASS
jgi:hypothetical protein